MSTVTLGLGACPAGSSLLGFGTPATTPSRQARILVRDDGSTGSVVRIDPSSGDYVLDDHGNKLGDSAARQKVQLALRTMRGSSAVDTMGIEAPGGIIRDDTEDRNRLAVVAALKAMLDAGEIELIDVITTRIGGPAVEIEVRWRELPNGRAESAFA